MRMLNDGLGLLRMRDIIGETLLQVREVILYLDIVVVGLQRPLHKPGLTRQSGGDGNGIRRHHPLQVRRHVIAL